MYTAGTCWLRERRWRREKASGSIGFRGAGNSGPEAGFDQVQSKIGDRRKNQPSVKVEAGLEHRRHTFLKDTISMAVPDFGIASQGWLVLC